MERLKLLPFILLVGSIAYVEGRPFVGVLPDTGISREISALEEQVLELVNDHRISQNLKALPSDPRIAREARRHSRALAEKQILFGHYGFDLRTEMISSFIPIGAVAENVAHHEGCTDCGQQAVRNWLKSSLHRKNIEGDYDLTGVGVAKESDQGYFFTQIFVKRGTLNQHQMPPPVALANHRYPPRWLLLLVVLIGYLFYVST